MKYVEETKTQNTIISSNNRKISKKSHQKLKFIPKATPRRQNGVKLEPVPPISEEHNSVSSQDERFVLKDDERYHCTYAKCNIKSLTKEAAILHHASYHVKSKCSIPGCTFQSELNYLHDQHMRAFHSSDLFKCRKCPFTTNTNRYLRAHQKNVHKMTLQTKAVPKLLYFRRCTEVAATNHGYLLTPLEKVKRSGGNVHWQCKSGHNWLASLDRARGRWCMICSKREAKEYRRMYHHQLLLERDSIIQREREEQLKLFRETREWYKTQNKAASAVAQDVVS